MRNIIKKLIVSSLLTVSVLGIFVSGCKKSTANIPVDGDKEIQKDIESLVTDGDGNNLSGNKVYEMPQKMVFSAPAMQTSENTTKEITVTATVTPDEAANKLVDWSVSFKNASSTWAKNKTVTDYVTVTPTSDGALSAKVTCKEAFGEQIILTCASRAYPDVTASCTIDFKRSVAIGTVSLTTCWVASSTQHNDTLLNSVMGTSVYLPYGEKDNLKFKTGIVLGTGTVNPTNAEIISAFGINCTIESAAFTRFKAVYTEAESDEDIINLISIKTELVDEDKFLLITINGLFDDIFVNHWASVNSAYSEYTIEQLSDITGKFMNLNISGTKFPLRFVFE